MREKDHTRQAQVAASEEKNVCLRSRCQIKCGSPTAAFLELENTFLNVHLYRHRC